MAIAFRAKSSGDVAGLYSGVQNYTITSPAGTASTDILVASFAWDNTGGLVSLTPPSGWTAVANPVTSGLMRAAAFWSLGSNTNLTFSLSVRGTDLGWVCGGFTGVDNTTPVDATGTTSTSTGSTSLTVNAVTTVTANAWEIAAISPYTGSSGMASTGWTIQNNGASTVHQEADLAYRALTSAGSSGTSSFTVSSSSGQQLIAIPFALRPVAGGAAFVAGPYLPVLGRQAVHRANSY